MSVNEGTDNFDPSKLLKAEDKKAILKELLKLPKEAHELIENHIYLTAQLDILEEIKFRLTEGIRNENIYKGYLGRNKRNIRVVVREKGTHEVRKRFRRMRPENYTITINRMYTKISHEREVANTTNESTLNLLIMDYGITQEILDNKKLRERLIEIFTDNWLSDDFHHKRKMKWFRWMGNRNFHERRREESLLDSLINIL